MKFEFTCIEEYENGKGRRVTISLETVRLNAVIEDFENFLTACGFAHGGLTVDSKEEKSE